MTSKTKLSKICHCGMWITGSTERQIDYNMKLHRAGIKHRKQDKCNKKGDKK